MSSRRNAKANRKAKPKAVLIFGENENDTKVLRELMQAIHGEVRFISITMKKPPILIRDAAPQDLPSRTATICALIDVQAVDHDIVAVLAHEDCDDVEPRHIELSSKIENAFKTAGYDYVIAGVPAWEMETWLMLWPEAFARHVPTWAKLTKFEGKNVGLIRDAKEALSRELQPDKHRSRAYRESDAPVLAALVKTNNLIDDQRATSASFELFRQKVLPLGA